MAREMRTSRTQETHEAIPVREDRDFVWVEPTVLDTTNIPARPGYTQRWVRTKVKGEDDQRNVYDKINKGWRPRMVDSVPKGQYIPNIDFNGQNVIGIHGMILMERPLAQHESHARYIRQQTDNQMRSVKENFMRVHSPSDGFSEPKLTNTTQVSTGRIADPDD